MRIRTSSSERERAERERCCWRDNWSDTLRAIRFTWGMERDNLEAMSGISKPEDRSISTLCSVILRSGADKNLAFGLGTGRDAMWT